MYGTHRHLDEFHQGVVTNHNEEKRPWLDIKLRVHAEITN